MIHKSDRDNNPHYSVVGETGLGEEVKDGYVQEDDTQQTVSATQATSLPPASIAPLLTVMPTARKLTRLLL
jgi:hypothetical protein